MLLVCTLFLSPLFHFLAKPVSGTEMHDQFVVILVQQATVNYISVQKNISHIKRLKRL